jgi:hypothetical protein
MPYHGTRIRAATRVVTNIKVVDQMRGACWGAVVGRDSVGVVFDMGYLCNDAEAAVT